MKITAKDVKNAMVWEQRIFFISEFSELEEVRWVLNYEKTAENLNQIVQASDYAAANDNLR